jgi:hypothetical protein
MEKKAPEKSVRIKPSAHLLGQLPPTETWTADQRQALDDLARLFAEIAVEKAVAERQTAAAVAGELAVNHAPPLVEKSAIVSQEELVAFTGVTQPNAQARFLKNHNVAFTQHRNGTVVVRRVSLERARRHIKETFARIEEQRAAAELSGQIAAAALFVSDQEITALCGLKRPSAQAKWLANRGYRFERRVDGKIALQRAEIDAHTLSRPRATVAKTHFEPNWEALTGPATKRTRRTDR